MPALTIGYIVQPPAVNDDSKKPGYNYEIVQMFCDYTKIECHFKRDKNEYYGRFENGTWKGLISEFMNGTYDLIIPFPLMTEQRFQLFKFSLPFYSNGPLLITRRSEASSSLSAISALVFRWDVWLCLFGLATVIGLLIALFQTTNNKLSTLYKTVINTLDIFLFFGGQTYLSDITKLSLKFLLAFWGFGALIVAGVYSGSLVSSIIRNKISAPFIDLETFIDCLEDFKCQLIMTDYDKYSDIFTGVFKDNERLKSVLKQNPILDAKNLNDVLDSIANTNSVYLVTIVLQHTFMYATKGNMKCLFAYFPLTPKYAAFGYLKNSFWLANKIDSFVEYMRANGLINRFTEKYFHKAAVCQSAQIITELKPVNLISFFGCLVILLFGSTVGCGAFLIEKIKPKVD